MSGKPRDARLVDRMIELNRERSRLEAELSATIVEFLDLRRAEPVEVTVGAEKAKVVAGEFAADEVAAALSWSTNRVHSQARQCRRLRAALPRMHRLWRSGAIDGYTAGRVVAAADRLTWPESVTTLDAEAAERVVSQTPAQLSRWLNRRVARLEPDATTRRHRRALGDRKVTTTMDLDGMGSLWMAAGAADITAIDSHLTTLARGLGGDDPRTMDQRRVDLAVDLLTGRRQGPDGMPAVDTATGSTAVAIVVPVQSLLGVDDAPGELADRGASVPAEMAREIASRPGTLFYRLLTDERGHLLDVTQIGRFPSRLLGFAVDIRDGTCRYPTCTTSAAKCDHDHTVPAPDGPTSAANLGNGCRPHHRGRTHAGFDLRQPKPGVFVWTTPTGHRYVVQPEPLPVGRWPTPTLVDETTPIDQLIDLIGDADPPLDETTATDALEAWIGHHNLLAWEADILTASPARAP